MNESDRKWWRDWVGARRDPAGAWEDRPAQPEVIEATVPGDQVYGVTMRSYGSDLDAVVLRPESSLARQAAGGREPVVVVPFYETASLFGAPCPRRALRPDKIDDQAYARHIGRYGCSVIAVPWWFEAVAAADPRTASEIDLHARYGPAAERHSDELTMTALGRSIGDLLLVLDYLLDQPWVDPMRIGVFGHSLGAKLALHLAALDPRVAAAVAHEPGLGLAWSNWDAPWYLGEAVPDGRDHDELLGLIAPRAFLFGAGGASDGEHNRHLLEQARSRWGSGGLDLLDHREGHPMSPAVISASVAWITAQLGVPIPVIR